MSAVKISLLFPPSWHPSQPYLSLPSLTGFLGQAGITNVRQHDLNIEILDRILTQTYARQIYIRLVDKVKKLEREGQGEAGPGSKEHYARLIESLERFPYLFDRIEPAKDILRGEAFYDLEQY